ncbi:MAG TPA: tetratricopeptide repeat protein [Dongiaceae bacterium]|nr:tetratricopeptide repeat protein [Dongiaceae bacterium]
MDEVTATGSLLKLWVWVETNKRPATWGAGIAVMLGLVIWFFVWRHSEQEVKAGEALSEVFVPQMLSGSATGPSVAQGYLKVAAAYPGYDAGAQALLLGAGDLFIEGKYEEAKAQFQRFVREHGRSPLESAALLGVAACLDAEHKPNEARTAYKSLIDQHPNDPVVLQAKFSLARLYAAQNQPEMARNYFEEVARNRGSLLSSEAGLRLEELYQQHPELAPAAPPSMQLSPKLTAVAPTNAPAKAPTNAPARAPAPAPAKAPAKSEKK